MNMLKYLIAQMTLGLLFVIPIAFALFLLLTATNVISNFGIWETEQSAVSFIAGIVILGGACGIGWCNMDSLNWNDRDKN